MKKKTVGLFIFLFAGIFILMNFVSAVNYQALHDYGAYCDIENSSTCTSASGGNIVMGLTNTTNAHGQDVAYANGSMNSIYPNSQYPYVLCCHFAPASNPTVANKIIGLADQTNSHAEIPEDSNYQNNIIYGGIQCVSTTEGCDSSYYLNMTSLVATTNSHIGGYTNYTYEICCKILNFEGVNCQLTSAVWNRTTINAGGQSNFVINGTNCEGMDVNYTIRNSDGSYIYSGSASGSSWSTDGTNLIVIKPFPSSTGAPSKGTYYYNATVYLGGYSSQDVISTTDSKGQTDGTLTVNPAPDPGSCPSTCSGYLDKGGGSTPSTSGCLDDGANGCIKAGESVADYYHSKFGNPAATSWGCYWNASAPKGSQCYYNESVGSSKPTPSTTNHTECQNSKCVLVQGDGVNQCDPEENSCTIPTQHHNVCISKGVCGWETGTGSDQCMNSTGCMTYTYNHTECETVNGAPTCVLKSGDGVISCLPLNGSCSLTPPSYTYCPSQLQCATTTDASKNTGCSLGSDCIVQDGLACPDKTTLCYNKTSDIYQCTYYNCEDFNDPNFIVPPSDGKCDFLQGCESQGCLNVQGQSSATDTCYSNSICKSTSVGPRCMPSGNWDPINPTKCGDGQILCAYSGVNFCWYGSSCPLTSSPVNGGCNEANPSLTCTGGVEAKCVNGKCVTTSHGSCAITTTSSGTCKAGGTGLITVNQTAVWSGDLPASSNCKSESKKYECPPQTPLPFFNTYNAIATIAILILIYAAIVLAKKKSKKTKRTKTRHTKNKGRKK